MRDFSQVASITACLAHKHKGFEHLTIIDILLCYTFSVGGALLQNNDKLWSPTR